MNNEIFEAPWSRQLKWITALSSALLLGIPLVILARIPQAEMAWRSGMVLLPLAILATCAFFAIRGYVIDSNALLICRPGWKTRISLQGLQEVAADPKAMDGSIRVFGNGGLFCFAGLYRNSRLGRYRAFATDQARAVVLKFPGRTLVVTPGDPQKFVAALESNKKTDRETNR